VRSVDVLTKIKRLVIRKKGRQEVFYVFVSSKLAE
jgi:hypothetical protein